MSPSVRRTALAAFVAFSACCVAVPALADTIEVDEARARELFVAGVRLASEERWAEAEHAFAESEALVPRASTAYDRALALYRLGRLKDMLVELDRFAAWSDPDKDAADREAAERLRRSAEAALATLTVRLMPPSAALEVDRVPVGAPGGVADIRLDPGEHLVFASATGAHDAARTVRLAAGDRQTLSLMLGPLPPPPLPERVAPPPRDEPPRGRDHTVPVAFAVASGITLAASLVTGVLAGDLDRKIGARCTGSVCPPEFEDDQSRMKRLAVASDVLLVTGVVFAGAGLTFYLLEPDRGGAPTAALTVGPGSVRLAHAF